MAIVQSGQDISRRLVTSGQSDNITDNNMAEVPVGSVLRRPSHLALDQKQRLSLNIPVPEKASNHGKGWLAKDAERPKSLGSPDLRESAIDFRRNSNSPVLMRRAQGSPKVDRASLRNSLGNQSVMLQCWQVVHGPVSQETLPSAENFPDWDAMLDQIENQTPESEDATDSDEAASSQGSHDTSPVISDSSWLESRDDIDWSSDYCQSGMNYDLPLLNSRQPPTDPQTMPKKTALKRTQSDTTKYQGSNISDESNHFLLRPFSEPDFGDLAKPNETPQSYDKRMSMPVISEPKHVRFQVPSIVVLELISEVPELFGCIRRATQRDLFEDTELQKNMEPAKAFYEVMCVGRAKFRGKKIMSSHIDDLIIKLEGKEEAHKIRLKPVDDSDRSRHTSGSSVKSLPTKLDEAVDVKENELQNKVRGAGAEIHLDSPTHSSEDILERRSSSASNSEITQSNSMEQLSENSSTENLGDQLHSSDSGDHLKEMFGKLHQHPELASEGQGQTHSGMQTTNRTMLFRIGQFEISLISLDKKQTIIEKKFKDIASVSQGNLKADVFGFITREPGNVFLCHLLRCHSASVVDEIMLALKTSFQSAYEQRRLQTQQICINCPLHQYHKLCQDINGLSPETAYNLLSKRIQQLPDRDANELYHSLQNENPQSYEESVEVLMIALRKMCEHKQKDHSHISDSSRISSRSDFNLLDTKGKTSSAFDNLRNKAKKTLTTSFESLITKAHTKSDEVRERFRHRSGTNESEASFNRSTDSQYDTPDASPAPSPAFNTKDQNFSFPSPPPSPVPDSRPRSSTLGAIPDPFMSARRVAHEDEKKRRQEEQAQRRANESPMKHMFIMANSSSPCRQHMEGGDENSLAVPESYTPTRRGSWRQAIFNRVVTPARQSSPGSIMERSIEGENPLPQKRTSEEIRALWKKAILETLLLIRMEKENLDLRARQDEMHLKRQKLDYQEIIPCLKDVSILWDEMLNTPHRGRVKFDDEKLFECVKQGVPQLKRGEIWWLLVEQHRLHFTSLETKTPKVEYNELLKQLTTHQHAILIDLGRTFPGHPYFSMQLGNGQLALFNLLKAYSLMDADVGYCQGLSFVAGILLMHMEETVAFEAWKHVMYNLGLRKQYRPNMIALQVQLYQLTRLIHDNYRDLYEHFEIHEIAPTLYAAPWFLTLFASQFPLGFVARVFDLIFIQGIEVIFKVALVLLGNHRELIMHCDSFETIVDFIKTTLPELGMIQMERVINQVFDMDISTQLQAYEVEYHVLKEEMMYSPQKGESDLIQKLDNANHSLKHQNMELIEKLQQSHSQQRSLESLIHNFQTQEAKLKSHIRTLEIERSALLNAVSKLKQMVPESDQVKLEITLPALAPSLPPSPIHFVGQEPSSFGKPDGRVQYSDFKVDMTKSARYHPASRISECDEG